MALAEFEIYRGVGEPDEAVDRITLRGPSPPWRGVDGEPGSGEPCVGDEGASVDREGWSGWRPQHLARAQAYRPDKHTVRAVNTALHLRRPLLVTGDPGCGKSALAYAVAYELRLGPVLHWPIASRSVLQDALYRYDAVGRIEDASVAPGRASNRAGSDDVGRYVRLGPLGTALAPHAIPRVLLIDEIDKSDVDLPNDLLNVIEGGEFEIPELRRIARGRRAARVWSQDSAQLTVRDGVVRSCRYPVVIMTSNGDRDFPRAFLRRCVPLEMPQPSRARLAEIIAGYLDAETAGACEDLIDRFLALRSEGLRATDQLLNAVYLQYRASGEVPTGSELEALVMQDLDAAR